MTKQPGRKRDSVRTRAAIMKAALKEFSASGYSGARIERIARGANCPLSLLYHYFSGKEALYREVLREGFEHFCEAEAKADIDHAMPLRGIVQLFDFVYRYTATYPEFAGLIRSENEMGGRFIRDSEWITAVANPLYETLARLIAAGQSQGIVRADADAMDIYVTILALARFQSTNASTVSAMLAVDLLGEEWQRRYRERSRTMLVNYLTDGPIAGAAPFL